MVKTDGKMNANVLHKTNKILILNLIKKEGEISRSEITTKTKLTPPTVTKIIDELVSKFNLVEYKGIGNSNGGRPSVIVKFKNSGNYIIGIDLGATYIRGSLVDLSGKTISYIQVPTEIENGFEQILNKIVKVTESFIQGTDKENTIWGVGIGVAGLVNKKTGMIESSPIFGWENINLKKELEHKINLPFYYDNSTRVMAHSELYFNKNSKSTNFAFINIGYGIAAGFVIDGNIVKGNEGFAGEFGHITVDCSKSIKCKCGKYGCLEAVASGHRISTLGKEVLAKDGSQILKDLCNGNPNLITAELVFKAYKMGDPSAKMIYERVTEHIAQGIGSIVNLLNPGIVYIGGGISLNGDLFFNLLEEKVKAYLLKPNMKLIILPSTYGEQATSIGAASLVLERILKLELP